MSMSKFFPIGCRHLRAGRSAIIAVLASVVICTPAAAGDETRKPAEDATTRPSPPPGAVVLLDGSNLDAWQAYAPGRAVGYRMVDGAVELEKGNIVTRREFGDFRLYLEFYCAAEPPEVTGQKHANSGVYLHDRYEIQILGHRGDSLPTDKEVGAIYGIKGPDRFAVRPDGTWQSFDCVFLAPRFDAAGKKVRDARLTMHHNGVLIHDDVPIPRTTGGARGEEQPTGPIRLQDKNHPVLFRNIWVVPLGETPDATTRPAAKAG